MRWTAAGSADAAVRLEDPPELALDLVGREAPDVEPLEARQDRRREVLRVGRGEHEDDELGRLLERLEEGVPGVLRDLVGLVEDVDLAAQVGRGVVDALAELADGVDPAVRGGIDLEEVHRPALADRDARRAGVARVAVLEVRAVERLGEDPGQRGLAGAARPDEEDRVRRPARSGRRSGASRRPPPGRRSGRTSGRASGGRWPGAACSGSRAPWSAPADADQLPCTPCRSTDTRAHHRRRLGPGRSAAPDELR